MPSRVQESAGEERRVTRGAKRRLNGSLSVNYFPRIPPQTTPLDISSSSREDWLQRTKVTKWITISEYSSLLLKPLPTTNSQSQLQAQSCYNNKPHSYAWSLWSAFPFREILNGKADLDSCSTQETNINYKEKPTCFLLLKKKKKANIDHHTYKSKKKKGLKDTFRNPTEEE